jgi:hypothetical protein
MQASGGGQPGPEEFERELRRVLYRFDCPEAQVLGDYQLDLLEPDERTRVAQHAVGCDECQEELHMLRAFLAQPDTVPVPALERVRRIVARLFTPPDQVLAYGGLRGATNNSTRVFEADDVTVTLGRGQGSGSLIGLVVALGQPPEALEDHEVRLLPREGGALTTRLDDLGNFEFTNVNVGAYVLEIDLIDGVLVIEELQVD